VPDRPPDESVYDAEPVAFDDAPTVESLSGQEAPFRPTARPPVAYLTVCDDGSPDGELVRIRGARFVIGRTDGDLRLPHDDQVSGRHAEIARESAGGRHRWVVTDLGSTNGLFVRVRRARLEDRTEFLLGRGRYLFEGPKGDFAPGAGSGTQKWVATALPCPALVEVVSDGGGNRFDLKKAEYWAGSDPRCQVCRSDDPFVAPRHARIYRDPKGVWHVTNNNSYNGVWVRTGRISVDGACSFQVGEQRFRLRVGVVPSPPALGGRGLG
jgi:pSer/pThr/pTyr-binding forkhead associated (FHA) protein